MLKYNIPIYNVLQSTLYTIPFYLPIVLLILPYLLLISLYLINNPPLM